MPTLPRFDIDDFLAQATSPQDRFEQVEARFNRMNARNTLFATIKWRDGSYRVKFIMSGDHPEGSERPRIDFNLTATDAHVLFRGIHPARERQLAAGDELTLNYNGLRAQWEITSTTISALAPPLRREYSSDAEALPTTTRNRVALDIDEYAALPQEVRDQIEYANEDRRVAEVRFRNTQARLRNSEALADDYRNKNDRLAERADALARLKLNNEATIERQATTIRNLEQATRRNEGILSDTDALRRTAAVWRDATNGTPAKLKAFKEFCTALDSLPALAAEE